MVLSFSQFQPVSLLCLSDFPHQPYPFCLEPVIMSMVEIGRHCSSCAVDLGVRRPAFVMWCSEMTSLRLLPFFPLAVSIVTGKLKHSQSGRLPHGLLSRPPLTLISFYSCVRGMESPLSLIILLYSLYLHIFSCGHRSLWQKTMSFCLELNY